MKKLFIAAFIAALSIGSVKADETKPYFAAIILRYDQECLKYPDQVTPPAIVPVSDAALSAARKYLTMEVPMDVALKAGTEVEKAFHQAGRYPWCANAEGVIDQLQYQITR